MKHEIVYLQPLFDINNKSSI